MTVQHILIPIVMEQEAKPFCDHLGLEPTTDVFPPHVPFEAFQGEYHSTKITVITLGKDSVYGTKVDNIGTTAASLATFLAIQNLLSNTTNKKVDLVVNAGTCGGFRRKGLDICSVVLTTGVAHHDRRIPIPGFDTYGIGKLSTLDPTKIATALGYHTGICTTGNSLDFCKEDEQLMLNNDASCKDMEAAAIAWVCALEQVPYLGVKVVTDIVDGEHPPQDEFLANLSKAATTLQQALPKVIEYICDHNHI